jgi:hypothetical protein
VKLVYLFGSAIDSPKPRDLDLAIWTDPPLSLDDLLKRRADLILHIKSGVDLVALNDASITLAHEVVDRGRCLYARDPEIETEFVTRSRARYWDFKPYRDEQWRLSARRLEERLGGP